MKTFASVSVAGVLGLLLLKFLWAVVVPALGLFLGLLALTMKLALWAAVIWFVLSLLRRRKEQSAA